MKKKQQLTGLELLLLERVLTKLRLKILMSISLWRFGQSRKGKAVGWLVGSRQLVSMQLFLQHFCSATLVYIIATAISETKVLPASVLLLAMAYCAIATYFYFN